MWALVIATLYCYMKPSYEQSTTLVERCPMDNETKMGLFGLNGHHHSRLKEVMFWNCLVKVQT